MTVQPGRNRPSASAAATIASAGRSLMEPVGLRSSSLAQILTAREGERRGNPISGVLPTESIRLSYLLIGSVPRATGDGRQDGHLIAVGHRGPQAAGEAYVFIIDIYV